MSGRDQLAVSVKLHSEHARLPVSGSEFSAGSDVFSAVNIKVPAGGKALVQTDISIAISDPNYYIRVAPRSGLAVKNFIDVGAGVVDYDYRGLVGVVLFNHSSDDFEVKQGDRIAQLIFERIAQPVFTVVDDLPETQRGAGGFGSTGTK